VATQCFVETHNALRAVLELLRSNRQLPTNQRVVQENAMQVRIRWSLRLLERKAWDEATK
jgi:hypothetical protein